MNTSLRSVWWLSLALTAPAMSASTSPVNPFPGEPLFRAVRENDETSLRRHLAAGLPVDARDQQGNTPLHAAGISAGPAVVTRLLEAGADPNAVNDAGATPLHRAAARPELAELLLAAEADVTARSRLGNTPLMVAARQRGSADLLKRLLDAGADINAANIFGATALQAAAAAGDVQSVRLLLDRGAHIDAKPTSDPPGFVFGGGRSALMWAAYRGDESLVRLLLERGASLETSTSIGTALTQAAWGGHKSIAAVLVEAGAKVDSRDLVGNYTPLHWAASSERRDPGLVDFLLRHDADPRAPGGEPVDSFLGELHTPLSLARLRGETPIVQRLSAAEATSPKTRPRDVSKQSSPSVPVDPQSLAPAIARAIEPLQRSATESRHHFARHLSKQNCISCHQQYLPMAAVGMARELRFPIDEVAAREQIRLSFENPSFPPDYEAQAIFHPEAGIEIGYHLLGLHYEKQAPNALTDSFIHYLLASQEEDGSWRVNMPRPPLQSSDVAATALATFSLATYPIPGRKDEIDRRLSRAVDWLRHCAVETNEERAYQMLGLHWAGQSASALAPLAEALVAEQRPDGGWAQLAGLDSDAYATGLSLFALAEAGDRDLDGPAVQRAARFLLTTQAADGSWHVRTRAFPFQPPMQSGYPYGRDSWISAAGASWAVMALAALLDPSDPPRLVARSSPTKPSPKPAPPKPAPSTINAPHDFARDILPAFERSCVTCHSGDKPKGGFRIESREALVSGGNRGEPAVVPGRPEASPLLDCVTDAIEDLEMPPLKKRDKFPALTPDEIASLRAWIAAGAPWPDGLRLQAPTSSASPTNP